MVSASSVAPFTGTTTAVTTTPQSVSVGLVMTVTPQISENDTVILNVRPTISSISALKEDPNPSIPAGIKNLVPQIRTREIESVMRVSSGDIAVLGGLMEDAVDYKTGRVPVLGQIPLAGELLTKRDNSARKTELVIFLRPVVIKDASLNGDFAGMKDLLPDRSFFNPPPEAAPLSAPVGR
ncbi:MAG TPA: type II and III secretion system protein, partial [Rhodocyclaceae bacterium]|nr:type II and III secretion system protein [Rhodocyclaceae bacterium]